MKGEVKDNVCGKDPKLRFNPFVMEIFSITRVISVTPNSSRTGSKFENTNQLHSPPPVEFFKLFITDDFVTKMAEQTNSYAVQRGAPRSFKPLYDGVINLYF